MSENEAYLELSDPNVWNNLIYGDETYRIIGCCMQVHTELGRGFSEVIYKDALDIEFMSNKISFERERKFHVSYKGTVLRNHYFCDYVLYNKIILEVKAQSELAEANTKQVMNYLAVTGLKLGLLVNFGEASLRFKRIIL